MAKGGNVIFDFDGNTKPIENKMSSLSKSVAKGTLITTAVTKGISAITSSLDGAIKRVDTLNNFPNVMRNLGIGAKESSQVINELSDKLNGLPTTLDDAAGAVQRFTSKNGDVKKSAKMFLAVNNAILAGGAGTQIQTSALEQLSQAYSKGRIDMMEWRTLQMAMPAQLNQVAKAMGITSDQLGEGLREGSISMDDFINTITRLNTKGVGEFASFEQQARGATGGIQTSITNLKTAITRGVANIINSFNDMLTKNNLPTLQEMIKIASAKISEAFTKMSKVIQGLNLAPVISLIKGLYKAFQILKPILPVIIASLVGYKLALLGIKAVNIVMGIMSFAKAFLTLIPAINGVRSAITLLNVAFSLNPIGIIIALIAGLVAIFVVLWNKCEWFRNFWIGLWEGIKTVFTTVWEALKTFFTETIPNAFTTFIEKAKNILLNLPYYIGYVIGLAIGKFVMFIKRLWTFATVDIPNFITKAVAWFKTLPSRIWQALKLAAVKFALFLIDLKSKAKSGIRQVVSNVISGFRSLPSKIKDIGLNIIRGLWNGIKNAKKWLLDKIKSFAGGVLDGLKDALGIHSPSKITFGMGVNLDKGMINGMTSMQKELQNTFDGMFDLSPNLYGNTSANFSPSVNVVNNISMEQDPLGQMVRKVKTFSGGAKNDFNYGMGV